MAEPVSVKVTGTESVERAYQTVIDGAADLPGLQQKIANLLVPAVRGAAPVRTGALVASIGASAGKGGVLIGAGGVYGGVIEWGWAVRGIGGRHYMARGVMANQQAVADLYGAALTELCATAQAGG